ncbi:MAG: hypothetical protein LBN21_07545 [Treponema sp.]|jgi:hypothetical protein|nr:hypothetical protein [Treponema sp.]
MDKERNKTAFISDLLGSFAAIFTTAFLVLSLVVMLVTRHSPYIQDISALFAFGSAGISYSIIFQIAGFSFILAIIKVFLFSELFFVKMRFLWRTFLLFLATVLTFSIFAVIFNWFQVNEPLTWLGFFISTSVCFSVSFCLTLLKLKLEGRKYDKLLANYKARKGKNDM